jgi:hypothetical protein
VEDVSQYISGLIETSERKTRMALRMEWQSPAKRPPSGNQLEQQIFAGHDGVSEKRLSWLAMTQ